MAKGFNQQPGLDFYDTFSLVIKITTIRLVLSLVLHFNWKIEQLDAKNAFLHGFLEEHIFMQQLQGFVDLAFPKHVCRLRKAIYGLRQAPRAWYARFSTFLLSKGFRQCHTDNSLFVRHLAHTITILLLYVDDILITGNDVGYTNDLLQTLHFEFDMRHLGELKHFLGIEVTRYSTGMRLSQETYAKQLLQKAGMIGCKPCDSPILISDKTKIVVDDPLLADPTYYRRLVGALQYLTITRPDIAFSVNSACQHMDKPRQSNYQAVKKILRYRSGTTELALHYKAGPLQLHGYANSNWAGDSNDRRFTSGICIMFCNNPIMWSSKKQHTVARSSTKAEY